MIWDKEIECCSDRKKIEALQLERLKHMVAKAYNNVPFYQKKMDEAGMTPDKLKSLDDLKHIPFTVKNDLRDNYPFGLFAEPMKNVSRIHASSGTTGKPVVAGYTKSDLDNWSNAIARIVTAAGVSDEDIAQVAFGYGLFTGGFGVHYGGEKIGATVIPVSSGNSKRQIQIMHDFGSTFLACTPSYALSLAETLHEMGYTKDDIHLAGGCFGAEPWTENMRAELEDKLGLNAYDIYGLSEIMGPGVSYECGCKAGMHINEDHFIPEIIDPDTGEVLPAGSKG